MAFRQKTVTVGGREYVINEWDTAKTVYWLHTLLRLIAPAFDGAGDISNGLMKMEINIGRAIKGVLLGLTPSDAVRLSQQILKESLAMVHHNGVMSQYSEEWFNTEFAGAPHRLFELIEEIVAFNLEESGPALKKKVLDWFGLLRRPANG